MELGLYREGYFDGKPDIAWLSQGWKALRLYGRRARAAIEAQDMVTKGQMLGKAGQLLVVMSGILDTDEGETLGTALMTIYTALQFTLLRANLDNSLAALDDFDRALALLDRDMMRTSESVMAA
jgi:flagellin-specific chaperone FliS